jgi:hypothetical protein
LRPKWDFRKILEDEPEDFFLVLVGKRSNTRGDKRAFKNHVPS